MDFSKVEILPGMRKKTRPNLVATGGRTQALAGRKTASTNYTVNDRKQDCL